MRRCILASLLALPVGLLGIDVSASGSWTRTVTVSDLQSGAGSNLTGDYESATGATTLTITNALGGSWRIMARRADTTWHGNLAVSVRRTSSGTGLGSVAGGETYIQLSTLDTEIFTGSADRSDIAVQYKLTGMSVGVSPDTYQAGVVFTVVAVSPI